MEGKNELAEKENKASQGNEELKKKEDLKETKKEKKSKKDEKKKRDEEEKSDKPKFKQIKEDVSKKDYKDLDKIQKKYKNKKKIFIGIGFLLLICLVFSMIFAILNFNNDKIVNGISIKGIDVSNLTKEEAVTKLQDIYSEKLKKEINLQYEDYETAINPTMVELAYDIEKAVDEACSVGKRENIFVSNFEIVKAMIMKQDIDVDMSLNEDVLRQTVEDLGTKLPGIVIESSYYVEDTNLIIQKGSKGICINTDELISITKNEFNNIEVNQDFITIPVFEKEPEAIDINKIHEEVHTEVQDAYYTKDPFEIHPEVEGIDFDVSAAQAILDAEDKQEYIIPLTITKPKITINDIGTEAFPDLLATFTTKYDASNTDRTTNLRIACQKLDGKVILAGETFSYNKTLGERTVAAGYRNGKIYENGQVVDGIGGGICQISTTLYNAVLMSNLEIVERRNHQFVTSYVPAGRDATVSYGTTDFKFKNTRTYPIRLKASIQNGIATVSVYGIKEAEEYIISFETRTVSTIPQTTQYVEDASLAPGEEVIKQKGTNGVITETYMTKTLNGKFISKTLLSRDTYSAMQRIINRGKTSTTTE